LNAERQLSGDELSALAEQMAGTTNPLEEKMLGSRSRAVSTAKANW